MLRSVLPLNYGGIEMKVNVQKSDGVPSYVVPAFSGTMTVMNILDYIYKNPDHTLAYYSTDLATRLFVAAA